MVLDQRAWRAGAILNRVREKAPGPLEAVDSTTRDPALDRIQLVVGGSNIDYTAGIIHIRRQYLDCAESFGVLPSRR